MKDYETKGHRVARQDKWSPVAKRGREQREHTWATLVKNATSSVAQSQDVTRIFKWEGETISKSQVEILDGEHCWLRSYLFICCQRTRREYV